MFEFDPERPEPLTDADHAALAALAALPDSEIDTGEIPPLNDALFANAIRNPFCGPVQTRLTIQVDADILAWLKGAGRGYQSKLNAILRQAMRDETNRA